MLFNSITSRTLTELTLIYPFIGMQTAWVFGDALSILREIPEPYIAGYLNYGGSAYGNDSYDPLVLTYYDG